MDLACLLAARQWLRWAGPDRLLCPGPGSARRAGGLGGVQIHWGPNSSNKELNGLDTTDVFRPLKFCLD